MKLWQRAIETAKHLMRQLTVTQRLLIGSLATVLVMGLFLVQQYAAGPTLIPLFPGATSEEQTEAERFLQAGNFTYEVRDGQVMVPVDRRRSIVAAMAEAQALPQDNKLLFEQLIKDQSWTRDQTDKNQAEVVALQNELALIISRMNGIRSAKVFVHIPRTRSLGQPSLAPTASVIVFPVNAIDQSTADSIAELVASSRSGLSVDRVTVVDGTTNRRFRARAAHELSIGTNLELALRIEAETEQKIYEALSGIPNIVVAVRAQVDATQQRSQRNAVLPIDQGSITVPIRELVSEMETKHVTDAGEAGVRPNTGLSIETGRGSGTVTTESTNETESRLAEGRATLDVIDPRGFARKLNAVVNVPETAVELLWRRRNGGQDGQAPTVEQLQETFRTLREDITAIVTPLIATDLQDGGQTGEVTVTMMPVIADMAMMAGTGQTPVLMGIPVDRERIGGLARTALLSLLAVLSMGLVVVTALRSSRREELPSAQELVGIPPALSEEIDLIGEASEIDAALEARELTEEEVRSQQLFAQVQMMVRDNPEQAASLVGRWVRGEE
jgi:flagellar biosynthesis/type III secretory pathway M-ring protein FliF/YscJ